MRVGFWSISSRIIWIVWLKKCLGLWKIGVRGKDRVFSSQFVKLERHWRNRGSLDRIAFETAGRVRVVQFWAGREVMRDQKARCVGRSG